MLFSIFALLLVSPIGLCSPFQDQQTILGQPTRHVGKHAVDESILAAIKTHGDPVDALIALNPENAAGLAEPRLLQVIGREKPEWLTEGDKLRLHKLGQKFVDITDHEDSLSQQFEVTAGKACKLAFTEDSRYLIHNVADLPDFKHQSLVKPLFPKVSTERMHNVLKHMTSYYNRFYGGTTGALSAQWLHDHIAEVSYVMGFSKSH